MIPGCSAGAQGVSVDSGCHRPWSWWGESAPSCLVMGCREPSAPSVIGDKIISGRVVSLSLLS